MAGTSRERMLTLLPATPGSRSALAMRLYG